ncbi:LOW QUALITY PROTEIN: centrosomal protein of 85 kDa-like [Oncorhynchus keta]|uniref:LOW QUALITY PROTEIN: centrosomal protein of 85 kDa-like n=1 Tax=Oncorhynchus keta TaxID=8018 RepID=UPI00227B1D2E|nr:LOW QUALITY PROTEIN: centrosomal protein of 85 kDa-like [Oncorhynchus keta]
MFTVNLRASRKKCIGRNSATVYNILLLQLTPSAGLLKNVTSNNTFLPVPDFCSSSNSPSFQPIYSQIPIPTAHVMPSTAGPPASNPQPRSQEDSQASAEAHRPSSGSRTSCGTSNSKSSSLSKSASSPNLDMVQGGAGRADPTGPKPDCLSRCRSLVNRLDHSLFPLGGPLLHDEGQRFNMPAMEPTMNQSALLAGYCPDTQALLREAKAYEPMLQERCSKLPSWQQQHKQQLESLRMQVEQMQMMTAGVGQYPALYSTPSMPPETRNWDEVIKANESILKEKALAIERRKQQMSQLELRESELQVHEALLGRGAACLLRLQEAQRENAFLRAQFAERGDCTALEEAERSLGAVEAETRRLNDAPRETSERHAEEMTKQEERIRSRDKHINSLKKKCQKEAEQNREKQQRIETLERYLADLPTMEDYQGQSKQLLAQNQELTEQNLTLRERLEDSEKVNLDRTSSSLRPAGARLTQRLTLRASCLCDLRSLCNVLTQRSQGRDPNLSLLLGVSSPPPMAEQEEDWLSPEVLQRKLTEAQRLCRDVEELRTTVSDRYAQDMGENCITQ